MIPDYLNSAFFHMFKQNVKYKKIKIAEYTYELKFQILPREASGSTTSIVYPSAVILDVFGSDFIPVFQEVVLSLWNWKRENDYWLNTIQVTVELQMNHSSNFGQLIVAETIIHHCFDFRGVAGFLCCFNFLVTVVMMNAQTSSVNFSIALR